VSGALDTAVPLPAPGTRELRDLPAPAKLNLFLHVVGRRDDGMHLLQSLFVLVDWCDTIHVALRDDARLVRHDLGVALPEDDLCLRAARALQAATGTRAGADIAIDKQVPWGAGLGGGSSDAATTLIALNRLWGLGLPRARLATLALSLGADVPFFVGGRSALVEGIGERLTPVELPPRSFLVVKPAAGLPTADVFHHAAVVRDTARMEPADILRSFLADGDLRLDGTDGHDGHDEDRLGSGLHNDLEAAAQAICPDVARALEMLRTRTGQGRMSGSGSAVFATLHDSSSGKGGAPGSPAATEAARGPWPDGWTTRVCRSLVRHPLDAWLD
jgi:4-diphosphocytidyl-2-C-methyl-D-erythritol kinase